MVLARLDGGRDAGARLNFLLKGGRRHSEGHNDKVGFVDDEGDRARGTR